MKMAKHGILTAGFALAIGTMGLAQAEPSEAELLEASQRDEESAAFQLTGPDNDESPLPACRDGAPQ
jgi:hypothetical protein